MSVQGKSLLCDCNTADSRKLYLEQPLSVVLHGDLQLFESLRRLVLILRSILLKRIVVAAALTLTVFRLRQQERVAARPVLDLILSLNCGTVFYPQTKAKN